MPICSNNRAKSKNLQILKKNNKFDVLKSNRPKNDQNLHFWEMF